MRQKAQGMLVVQNTEPDLGIAHSLKLGLKRALDENPGVKRGAICSSYVTSRD